MSKHLFQRQVFAVVLGALLCWKPGAGLASDDSKTLDELEWIVATWRRDTSRGTVFEKWTKVSKQTFEGVAYRVRDSEETVTEYLRLEQFGSEIFYTAKVPENPYPVAFKLVESGSKTVTFENLNHDFPQRVIYTLKEDGSLHARIEGPRKGETIGVDFFFSKVK